MHCNRDERVARAFLGRTARQLTPSQGRRGALCKKSQATLFDCAQRKIATGQCPAHCGGDCAPANPPGASSHELRSDANGFPCPVGRQLKWFELGLDVSDSDGLVSVLDQLGYKVHRTYPNSIPEHHHVNFTASPGPVLPDFGPASHPAHPATAHAVSGHAATTSAPTGTVTLNGTDASFNQPSVDWAKVKAAGHDFAMSRCTDGLHSPDPKFGKARWNSSAAGASRTGTRVLASGRKRARGARRRLVAGVV